MDKELIERHAYLDLTQERSRGHAGGAAVGRDPADLAYETDLLFMTSRACSCHAHD
ncbi:MAG: hypothetical protein QOE58_3492 [Actinomycetota bacterium]|nr:hypothetical protein [Actinomycetota bacterium]